MKRARLMGLAVSLLLVLCSTAYGQPRLGPLTVAVVDEDGKPVPNAEVHCVNWNSDEPRVRPLGDNEKGVTNAEGRARFTERTTGQAFVRVIAGEKGGWFRLRAYGEESEATVTIDAGPTLRGTVRDADGNALPGVTILADACLPAAVTDASGRFEIPNVGVGYTPELSFVKAGYASTRTHMFLAASELPVSLKKGVALRGVVRNPDGTPATGATVSTRMAYAYHVHAGEDGGFSIADAPVGERVQVSAHATMDDVPYKATEKVVASESAYPIELRLERVVFGSIRGRVVHTKTKKPVRGSALLGGSIQSYEHCKEVELDEQGRFAFEGLRLTTWWVYVASEDLTHYQLRGPRQVAVKSATPVDVAIEVGDGCAIRGRAVTADGEPIVKAQVTWRPMPHTTYILTEKDGTFEIPYLDGAGVRYELEVPGPDGSRAKAEVGPLKAGQILEDVELRLPPKQQKEYSVLRGTVVDESGAPVPGVTLWFGVAGKMPIPMSSRPTDDEGKFFVKITASGPGKVAAHASMLVGRGGQFESLSRPCEIVGSDDVTLDAKEDRTITLTVRVKEPRVFGGRVVDAKGKPVTADLKLVEPNGHSNGSNAGFDGSFFVRRVPDGPFMVAVSKQGYKARVLFPEDEDLVPGESTTIVLEPGPFEYGESVWEAVTGMPPTEDSVSAMPEEFAKYVRSRESQFYGMATPPKRPEGPPPPPVPHSHLQAMRVVDDDGVAVKRVLVESHWQGPMNESRIYAKDGKPRAMSSPVGVYDFPTGKDVVVSAPGMGRVLVEQHWTQDPDQGAFDVVLNKAAALELRVVDTSSKPKPSTPVHAGRCAYDRKVNAQNWHVGDTGEDGTIRFEELAPGFHGLAIGDPGGAMEVLMVDLKPGEERKETVVLADGEGNAPQVVLQKLRAGSPGFLPRKQRINVGETVGGVPDADRKTLRDEVRARLDVLPLSIGPRDWYAKELRLMVAVAVALEDRKVVANLERRLEVPDSEHERLRSGGGMFTPLVDAIVSLEGNEAVATLAEVAGDPEVHRDARIASLMGLGQIATPESAAAFATLRDKAYGMPAAPKPKESYTHAERMAEAAHMVFWVMTLGEEGQTKRRFDATAYRDATVSEDYATGKLITTMFGGWTELEFRRVGDEWLLSRISGTVMA